MLVKKWFLYMIECQDGSIYTGITIDLAAPYAAHKIGTGARYTKSHPPTSYLVPLNILTVQLHQKQSIL